MTREAVPVPELGGLYNNTLVTSSVAPADWKELTYNEEILTLETGNIPVSTLDALSDLALVLVAIGR